MAKKKINELSAASRFVGAFFDGMSRNTTNRFLAKARKSGTPKPVLDKLDKIRKEKAESDALIKKYSQ